MSARKVFVPRPPSRALSSEPNAHPTDARAPDGDRDMFNNGGGKARSIAAFLGQKRGTGTDTASHETGQTQGPGVGQHANRNRRSFEGIWRPEMAPLSIIPYPMVTTQLAAGMQQSGVGQTPRKTAEPGAFGFPRPMTPVSVPRGFKKGSGIFAETREDEAISNGSAQGGGVVLMGPGGDADVRVSAGTGMGGYMRVFEGPGGAGSAIGVQSSLEPVINAPAPGYAVGGLGASPRDEECEVEGIFARSSRSLDAMIETEVGMERNNSLRSLGGTKRGMFREDMEQDGRYTDNGHQTHGSAKRTKQAQHDPNEYFPISSPHIPPTPELPTSSTDVLDPSLVAGSLFENIEELVDLKDIEADWKRWRECTTEEWLKGADELAQDYTDILNMVKDHLTEKVVSYASMVSSVEERRAEVDRNIEIIHGKGNVVRENIARLGTKK